MNINKDKVITDMLDNYIQHGCVNDPNIMHDSMNRVVVYLTGSEFNELCNIITNEVEARNPVITEDTKRRFCVDCDMEIVD